MGFTTGMKKTTKKATKGMNKVPGHIGTATGTSRYPSLGKIFRKVIATPFSKGGRFRPQHD